VQLCAQKLGPGVEFAAVVEGRVAARRFHAVGREEAVEDCDGEFEAAQDCDGARCFACWGWWWKGEKGEITLLTAEVGTWTREVGRLRHSF
jgi:hypothetical protein